MPEFDFTNAVCIVCTDVGFIQTLADKEPVSAPAPTKGIPNIRSFFNGVVLSYTL